jgi:hypothetical protein
MADTAGHHVLINTLSKSASVPNAHTTRTTVNTAGRIPKRIKRIRQSGASHARDTVFTGVAEHTASTTTHTYARNVARQTANTIWQTRDNENMNIVVEKN